jgi:hypothetical protein
VALPFLGCPCASSKLSAILTLVVKPTVMKKLDINWEGINEFLELTGAERSRRTGISVETWSRFRNGKRSPKVNRVAEIAPAFGLTEVEMFIALDMLKQEACTAESTAA